MAEDLNMKSGDVSSSTLLPQEAHRASFSALKEEGAHVEGDGVGLLAPDNFDAMREAESREDAKNGQKTWMAVLLDQKPYDPDPTDDADDNSRNRKPRKSKEQLEKEKQERELAEKEAAEKAAAEEKAAKEAAEKEAAEKEAKGEGEKSAEEKPAEEKPAEEKTAEEKTAEEKTAEEKKADAEKPEHEKETKAEGEKPAEAKPGEAKPAEAKPGEAKPGEVKPAENLSTAKEHLGKLELGGAGKEVVAMSKLGTAMKGLKSLMRPIAKIASRVAIAGAAGAALVSAPVAGTIAAVGAVVIGAGVAIHGGITYVMSRMMGASNGEALKQAGLAMVGDVAMMIPGVEAGALAWNGQYKAAAMSAGHDAMYFVPGVNVGVAAYDVGHAAVGTYQVVTDPTVQYAAGVGADVAKQKMGLASSHGGPSASAVRLAQTYRPVATELALDGTELPVKPGAAHAASASLAKAHGNEHAHAAEEHAEENHSVLASDDGKGKEEGKAGTGKRGRGGNARHNPEVLKPEQREAVKAPTYGSKHENELAKMSDADKAALVANSIKGPIASPYARNPNTEMVSMDTAGPSAQSFASLKASHAEIQGKETAAEGENATEKAQGNKGFARGRGFNATDYNKRVKELNCGLDGGPEGPKFPS